MDMTQVVTFLEVLLTPQFVLMVGHVDKSDEPGWFASSTNLCQRYKRPRL